MSGQLVDNPKRKMLQRILGEIRAESSALVHALDGPARLVGTREAWVGPAATTFLNEIEGHRSQVRSSVHNLIAAIERAIGQMPAKVTPEQAKKEWAAPAD